MKKFPIIFYTCFLILPGLSCSKNDSETQAPEQPVTNNQTENPTSPDALTPVLTAGQIINVGDKPISIGHTASPEIVDWNNDGKKDLILGTYITFPNPIEEGKVMLYLNEGTDEAPVFKKGEFMSAAGEIISVGAG